MKRIAAVTAALALLASPAAVLAEKKACEDLKKEIAEKLDAKGVKDYTLAIVAADQVKDAKVVGSCDGGTQKITYTRK